MRRHYLLGTGLLMLLLIGAGATRDWMPDAVSVLPEHSGEPPLPQDLPVPPMPRAEGGATGSELAPRFVPVHARLFAVFEADSEQAAAVLAAEEQAAGRYRAGDWITATLRLVEIESGSVWLEDRGVLFRQGLEPLGSADDNELVEQVQAVVAEEEEARQATQRETLLKHLDLQPIVSGQAQGYRIGDGLPDEVRLQVPVQPGDSILTVNGYPVGEEDADYLAWLSFHRTQKAAVVMERDGQQFTLYLPDDLKPAPMPPAEAAPVP